METPGQDIGADEATRASFVSLKRLVDESPWLQFTSECQRF
jgi:hypothetical protein